MQIMKDKDVDHDKAERPWYSNPGTVFSASTSARGGVVKYLEAQTTGSFDATENATTADGSSKKRKAKPDENVGGGASARANHRPGRRSRVHCIRLSMGNIAVSRRVQEDTIRISVRTMAGKVLALDVRSTDTLGDVKTKIHGELGVRPSRQRLVFDGKVLGDDGSTLAQYGVGKMSSCLHLAIRRWPGRGSGWMEVFVKVPSGRTLSVMVERSDTVWRIMEKVRDSEGVPVLRQRVVYCGKQLEDGRTMEEYDVKKESTLHARDPPSRGSS